MTLATQASNVTACWTLDETSGTRSDSVGSVDLTDNNTVTNTTGKFSNAASFDDANSEYLSASDAASVSANGDEDFMIRCWVRIHDNSATMGIFNKWDSGSNRAWQLRYRDVSDRFQFRVLGDVGGADITLVEADTLGAPSLNTWYLVHGWYDSGSNVIGIAVNAGTADTAAHTAGIKDDASAIELGRSGANDLDYFDGDIDDALVMKASFLTATERTEDYNSGTGVAFADWAAAGGRLINGGLVNTGLVNGGLIG